MSEDCTFWLPSEVAEEFPVAGHDTGSVVTTVGTTVLLSVMLAMTTSSVSSEVPSESSCSEQYRQNLNSF